MELVPLSSGSLEHSFLVAAHSDFNRTIESITNWFVLDRTLKTVLRFKAHPITELSALGSFGCRLCPRVSAVPQLLPRHSYR